MLAPLKKPHWTHRWYTTNVCTSSTGHKSRSQRQKRYTERCGTAGLAELHTTTSTQGLIHTLGHTARFGLTARKPRSFFFPQPRVQEGSRLPGPFQTPSQETGDNLPHRRKKPVCILPLTHLSMFWIEQALLRCPQGRFPPAVRGGGSRRYGLQGGWVRLPDGVWLVLWAGVWLLPGTPQDAQCGSQAPCADRRGLSCAPAGREASRGARDASAQEQPVLARPGSTSTYLTWKCRTGQWGWVGLPEALPWWIYRLTLPEVTEERNPSMTKHELPTSNKSLMRGGPNQNLGRVSEGGTVHSPSCFPFLTLRPPQASLVPWRNLLLQSMGGSSFLPCPSPAPLMLCTK